MKVKVQGSTCKSNFVKVWVEHTQKQYKYDSIFINCICLLKRLRNNSPLLLFSGSLGL